MPDRDEGTVEWAVIPEHVVDQNGVVWRVVRDGGMVTRADYGGIESCGIAFAEQSFGPLRPVYQEVDPDA